MGDFSRVIEKLIHFFWIGDETQRPDDCIRTWRDLNPGYRFRIWGNADLQTRNWRNAGHMQSMWHQEKSGVADLMRYEVLLEYGGVALDADSVCIRPLEDWLLQTDGFAAWENEWCRPGLVATGAMGFIPHHRVLEAMITALHLTPDVTGRHAWETVGPLAFTKVVMSLAASITIYPSHYFYPEHITGLKYTGAGPVFARQFWASGKMLSGKTQQYKDGLR